jgi:hypothetical protein
MLAIWKFSCNSLRVVFFESPAYWSVRDALNKSKEVRETGDLTGVSKYFYVKKDK